jgi:hypothetical protein
VVSNQHRAANVVANGQKERNNDLQRQNALLPTSTLQNAIFNSAHFSIIAANGKGSP